MKHYTIPSSRYLLAMRHQEPDVQEEHDWREAVRIMYEMLLEGYAEYRRRIRK